ENAYKTAGFSSIPGFFSHGFFLFLLHISEPTRLKRNSYAVFCFKKKKQYHCLFNVALIHGFSYVVPMVDL
ncbi:hypothetical protein CWI55_07055, partial [Neisseria meningitidis]